MIDLDEIEQAARKPWYCRSKQEDNLLSPEVLVELITRLRQSEKDAARYRWLRDTGCFEGSTDDLFHATPAETDAEFDRFMNASNN